MNELGNTPADKDYQPADAMKALDEKIKKVSERGTWDGVDVDKYVAELRGRDTELQQASKALADAVDDAVDAIERLKSVLLDLKKIKENKND